MQLHLACCPPHYFFFFKNEMFNTYTKEKMTFKNITNQTIGDESSPPKPLKLREITKQPPPILINQKTKPV